MTDLLDIAEREFPGAAIVASDDDVMVMLLRTHALSIHLLLERAETGWRARLHFDRRIAETIATHADPAEALRLARAYLEAMFAPMFEALSTPDDGAQEKAPDV